MSLEISRCIRFLQCARTAGCGEFGYCWTREKPPEWEMYRKETMKEMIHNTIKVISMLGEHGGLDQS